MAPYEAEAYDMALSLGQSKQARGGHARARVLTPEQRSEIAAKAANARWKAECTQKVKKGRRLAPRAYKDLPEYLASKLYQNSTLRHNLFRSPQEFTEICERTIRLALEERE